MVSTLEEQKFVKGMLLEVFKEAADKELEAIAELRKHRTQLPFATLTILTAALTLTEKFVNCAPLFLLAYTLLFLSMIGGLVATEMLLRYEIRSFNAFKKTMQSIREEYKNSADSEAVIKTISETDRGGGDIPSKISEASFYLLIAGLVILFVSVLPHSLIKENLDAVSPSLCGGVPEQRILSGEHFIKQAE